MNKLLEFFVARRPVVRDTEENSEPPLGALPTRGAVSSTSELDYELDFKTSLVVYLGLVLGVLGKAVIDHIGKGQGPRVGLAEVATALVLSAVTFASVFLKQIVNVRSNPLKFFVAVQNGFFVQAVIATLTAAYRS
jgi:hypothetical protein